MRELQGGGGAQVIKLSDAVQTLPRQVTSCVHGVASAFLEVGRTAPQEGSSRFTRGAYCLGKLVWGKGWEELLQILPSHLPHSSGRHLVRLFCSQPLAYRYCLLHMLSRIHGACNLVAFRAASSTLG